MPPNNVNAALEQNKGRKLQTGSKDDQHKFKRCGVKYTAAGREFSVFEILFDTFHGILVHLLHILRYFRILAFKKKWAHHHADGQVARHGNAMPAIPRQ